MLQGRTTRRRLLISAGALTLTAACAPAAAPGATATVAPTAAATQRPTAAFRWIFVFTIQANPSLPVILAREAGYYKEQGIDISWDFVTPSATGIRLMGAGHYEAGSTGDVGSVVQFVNEGLPIKVIAQQSQISGKALAVRKGSGITRPKDFEGKKVGIKSNNPWTEYLAMLAYDKVDRSKVTEVPVGFSSVELKEGIVDVLPVFTGNEPFVLRNNLKQEVDLIYPSDFGFPGIGSMTVMNTKFIAEKRDLALRWVKAYLRGHERMLADREASIDTAVRFGGTATSRAQHEFIYDVSKREMEGGPEAQGKGPGWINKTAWQTNVDILFDLGVIKSKPKVEDLTDTSLVEEVVKGGKVVWP